jgi:hypothetical protein
MPKKIRLWTIHNNGAFSLTDGRVDHGKSEYYMGIPAVHEAYPKLWRCLGVTDGQIIWCYVQEGDIPVTGTPKRMWELEVPESSVLTYTDDVIWNRILRIKVPLTRRYTKTIREKANKKFPDNPQSRRHYEKELEKKFWEDELSESALWNQLCLDRPVDGSSALIKHPVRKEWIIECRTLCCR